ncbi:MAG: MTH1187 family thiamine-binding protein [Armatimonadota bacterium]
MSTILAEFSITPMTESDMKPFIDSAVREIERAGLKHEVGPVGTTVEGELDDVLDAIKHAHMAALDQGVERVVTEIRIDEKKGGLSIEQEVEDYR